MTYEPPSMGCAVRCAEQSARSLWLSGKYLSTIRFHRLTPFMSELNKDDALVSWMGPAANELLVLEIVDPTDG